MNLREKIEEIQDKDGLVHFIETLRLDLVDNSNEWENPTLDMYLEAIQAWIDDSDGYFKNTGQTLPHLSMWKLIAEVLYVGKFYE